MILFNGRSLTLDVALELVRTHYSTAASNLVLSSERS